MARGSYAYLKFCNKLVTEYRARRYNLVRASDQVFFTRYVKWVHGWVPPKQEAARRRKVALKLLIDYKLRTMNLSVGANNDEWNQWCRWRKCWDNYCRAVADGFKSL